MKINVRNILRLSGIVELGLFIAGINRNILVLMCGLAALFLGITNFGKECPLFLSARHLYYRLQSKRVPPSA